MHSSQGKNSTNNLFSIILMIFVLVLGIVCLIGLIVSTVVFTNNMKAFSDVSTNAAQAIANMVPSENATAQTAITYLESLQQIQKNSTTNDVMSFVYSMLSTVLVALCAGFVAKSYKNVEIANKSVEEAKQKAEASENNAKAASNSAEQVQKMLNEFTTLNNTTLEKLRLQKDLSNINAIHIEIVHAKSALSTQNKIDANQRIANIKNLVFNINDTVSPLWIMQLRNEIILLKTDVKKYADFIESTPDSNAKISAKHAINRYNKDLTKAEKYCSENLLQKQT